MALPSSANSMSSVEIFTTLESRSIAANSVRGGLQCGTVITVHGFNPVAMDAFAQGQPFPLAGGHYRKMAAPGVHPHPARRICQKTRMALPLQGFRRNQDVEPTVGAFHQHTPLAVDVDGFGQCRRQRRVEEFVQIVNLAVAPKHRARA